MTGNEKSPLALGDTRELQDTYSTTNSVPQMIPSVNISELKKAPIWVNWKLIDGKGKVPLNPKTGGNAQSNNSSTWTDYTTATRRTTQVGLMLKNGVCGIDIDGTDGHTENNPLALEVLELFKGTYAELSPSGKGYHVLFLCDMSRIPTVNGKLDPSFYQKNTNNGLECYFCDLTKRYLTFTEKVTSDTTDIIDMTDTVLYFLNKYMRKPNNLQGCDDITAVLEKARTASNGLKFIDLYDKGDKKAYNDDDSTADLALCNLLAFWLQKDHTAIDTAFRGSALYRPKWERDDYRTSTIEKAIAGCSKVYEPKPKRGRPRKEAVPVENLTELPSQNKEYLTIEILEQYIREKKHTAIKYNIIKKQIDFINTDTGLLYEIEAGENASRMTPSIFATELQNELQGAYKGCNFTTIERYLEHIISKARYNPVLELIEATQYDGSDQLTTVYQALNIDEDDFLSRVLLKKWIWQALSLLRNNHKSHFETEGILVLQGEKQGSGKTTFCRILSQLDDTNQWFAGGREINFNDKDTLRRCISNFVVELGELDSTMKQDQAKIKSFITQDVDTYRVPYGRSDVSELRYTSLCATVNPKQYLVDPTGSRRFWTIPIDQEKEINHALANSIDVLQLYKQVDQEAKINPYGYKLTADERTSLMRRNGEFKKLQTAEAEILDILAKAGAEPDRYIMTEATTADFKNAYTELSRYSVQQLSQALKAVGIEAKRTTKNGKNGRFITIPLRVYPTYSN